MSQKFIDNYYVVVKHVTLNQGCTIYKKTSCCLLATGKLVLSQSLVGPGSSPGSLSCSVMAVSNNLLFVADTRGCITILRCDIKNGMLQVSSHSLLANILPSRLLPFWSLSVQRMRRGQCKHGCFPTI